MYKITVRYGKNDKTEFHNIVCVKSGLDQYTNEEIQNLNFRLEKPLYLYDNSGKTHLIPAKSFKSLTCEPEETK